MKPIAKQSNKKTAFTIVELLTVMSIIILLIGLLVPGLNQIRRYAKKVRQKAQFHSIGIALDLFNAEWDGYPPSEAFGPTGTYNYCGAMKLAEAMVGKDMCGFNPDSDFTAGNPAPPLYHDPATLSGRKQYLKLEGANAETIDSLYDTPPFDASEVVLCDVYAHRTHTGERKGMPILYYRANTSNTLHDPTIPQLSENIYNYQDNEELIGLQTYDKEDHYLLNPAIFYEEIRNKKIEIPRPYRADSYILISAGFDGNYGTKDDVLNYEK